MIIKNVSGLDVLRWISKKWQGNKTIATASNKLNVYKLHTCNENYDLKNNDGEDMRGNLFQWVDLKKWQYLAAFENDIMVGAQAYVIVPSIGRMWDGFIHAESKEIAIAINKDLFYKTRNQWKINYSEVTIPSGEDGKYFIFLNGSHYATSSDATVGYVRIYLNGSNSRIGELYNISSFRNHHNNVSASLSLSAGDTIEAYASTNGSGSIGLGTVNFGAFKIST